MLLALRFEPSRFFLKGKVRQYKQHTYWKNRKKLVRCEMNTKEEDMNILIKGSHCLSLTRKSKVFSIRPQLSLTVYNVRRFIIIRYDGRVWIVLHYTIKERKCWWDSNRDRSHGSQASYPLEYRSYDGLQCKKIHHHIIRWKSWNCVALHNKRNTILLGFEPGSPAW